MQCHLAGSAALGCLRVQGRPCLLLWYRQVTPVEYLAMLVEEGDTKSRQALEGGHYPDPLDYG